MPIFDSAKGDVPWYALPNAASTLFGGSTTSMQEEGTIYRAVSAGVSPAATGSDYVLAAVSLPAYSFDGAVINDLFGGVLTAGLSNRGIAIAAQGSAGPTNSTNKRIKLIVGATSAVVGQVVAGGITVADTGVFTTVSVGWSIGAEVYKYGAAGSNTQIAVHQMAQMGAAVGSLLSPQVLTLNESGNILIALTGNATTAVADIVANLFVLTGLN